MASSILLFSWAFVYSVSETARSEISIWNGVALDRVVVVTGRSRVRCDFRGGEKGVKNGFEGCAESFEVDGSRWSLKGAVTQVWGGYMGF